MPSHRRDFLKEFLAVGAFPGLIGVPNLGRAITTILDQDTANGINPDFDPKALSFWTNFLSIDGEPAVRSSGRTRGGDDDRAVFLHYGGADEGFKDATQLDVNKMVPEGDVMIGVNTSTIKLSPADQSTFKRLQNAQIRVDVAQKKPILPILEPMVYTVVGAMRTAEKMSEGKAPPSVQSIGPSTDQSWQKMQNIPLPGGKGQWALNLEAQRKDSMFCAVLQRLVKEGGLFMPMLGFPGIALSALNSFNTIYGLLHSGTESVIKANPVTVFATQKAVADGGAPGAVTGLMLKSGTYILIPAKQTPPMDQFKNLSVMQGRIVPPKTAPADLDAVAADTLKGVTYVTFDVEVTPTMLFEIPKKSA